MTSFIKKLIPHQLKVKFSALRLIWNQYYAWPRMITKRSPYIEVNPPINIDPRFLEVEDNARIQPNVTLITSEAKLVIKKYSAIGFGCTIIPGSHTPTVGLPQYLSFLHINDVQRGITINEDCWIGAESALLSRCDIGRGAVIGARSVVTKSIPPYAVVVGMPAKIIGCRFSIEQILEHEKQLYPEAERFTEEYLNELFEIHYAGLKSIGTSEMSADDLEKLTKAKQDWGIYPYTKTQL